MRTTQDRLEFSVVCAVYSSVNVNVNVSDCHLLLLLLLLLLRYPAAMMNLTASSPIMMQQRADPTTKRSVLADKM